MTTTASPDQDRPTDGDQQEPDTAPQEQAGTGDAEQTEATDPDPRNQEAAKYRHQRNEARTERDQLADRLAATEAAIVSHAVQSARLDARIWNSYDVDLNQYRDEAGQLDPAALAAHAAEIRAELHIPIMAPNPQQGAPSARRASSFEDAFNPRAS